MKKLKSIFIMTMVLLTFGFIFYSCDKDDKKPIPVKEIKISKTQIELTVGQSEMLQITFIPKDVTNKRVAWKSDNASIATVDRDGKVTGVTKGETKVSVKTKDGGKIATCAVKVK